MIKTAEENGKLCEGCSICCRYATVELDIPKNKDDIDEIRWLILHDIVVMVDEEGSWLVLIPNVCKELSPEGRCMIYEKRPILCRNYSQEDCEKYAGENVAEFRTVDQFFEYMKSMPDLKILYDEYIKECL